MALNGLNCAYVPLRNYSLIHSRQSVSELLRQVSLLHPRWKLNDFAGTVTALAQSFVVDCR